MATLSSPRPIIPAHNSTETRRLPWQALIRAVSELNVLPNVTHLGGNSGGNWFVSQLMYSQSFHDSLVNPTKPIKDVYSSWRDAYFASMKVVKESKEWNGTNTIPFEKDCSAINELVRVGLPMCAQHVNLTPQPPDTRSPELSACRD